VEGALAGDSLEQVGLNISLRFIFKPSHSPHCINTNVVGNLVGQMRERKIIDDKNGAEYLMFSATDIEFVNPLDYYSESARRLGFSMARDFLTMSTPEFPPWIIEGFAKNQAENFWKEQYAEILRTEVPKSWTAL